VPLFPIFPAVCFVYPLAASKLTEKKSQLEKEAQLVAKLPNSPLGAGGYKEIKPVLQGFF
jgi:hypothetical protein